MLHSYQDSLAAACCHNCGDVAVTHAAVAVQQGRRHTTAATRHGRSDNNTGVSDYRRLQEMPALAARGR